MIPSPSAHSATTTTARAALAFSLLHTTAMMDADSALARLQRLMAENGQRPQQAAAGGNPRGSRGGARASGAGGAASAAGTAPGSFGAFRGSSVPFMVHAHELEKVFNPGRIRDHSDLGDEAEFDDGDEVLSDDEDDDDDDDDDI